MFHLDNIESKAFIGVLPKAAYLEKCSVLMKYLIITMIVQSTKRPQKKSKGTNDKYEMILQALVRL